MSLQSKVVLGAACMFSIGIIGYVHYKQHIDRELLHVGVLKDVERRQRRKAENLYILQKQIDFTKELKKENTERCAYTYNIYNIH
ncbi:protein PET117 homolog, mitochondrial [Anoplophora glabripennis]|uniref:protein PET117 homolog, mitochondrial n=1 Tax=Anoplophora glabripennis TaxID=217634 RepID=UPI000873CD0C|nr:protein PET117 homolog, mitochondrial [Anoplophora glabripennis]